MVFRNGCMLIASLKETNLEMGVMLRFLQEHWFLDMEHDEAKVLDRLWQLEVAEDDVNKDTWLARVLFVWHVFEYSFEYMRMMFWIHAKNIYEYIMRNQITEIGNR